MAVDFSPCDSRILDTLMVVMAFLFFLAKKKLVCFDLRICAFPSPPSSRIFLYWKPLFAVYRGGGGRHADGMLYSTEPDAPPIFVF